jgi:large subunit ribosomal protein L13
MSKTHYTKPAEVVSEWHIVDAEDKILGRLASEVAKVLRGKHKPTFSTSVDAGDHVIVINADKVKLTGRKATTKVYRHHTSYPGGLKETSFRRMLENHPDRIITNAVQGMMPKNRLGRAQMKKLRVYAGTEHNHQAQQPKPLEV